MNLLTSVILICCIAGTLTPASGSAQDEAVGLFDSDRTLNVQITASWRKITRKKNDKRWAATLVVTGPDLQTGPLELTVERRGISRQRVCDFPPIRLRFDKQGVEGTIFQGEGALKLVTHCDNGDKWTQYYVLEMLAYEIYNLITDYSFRIRPMQIEYRDADRDGDSETHFGFVIEDVDELADRHDMEELDLPFVRPNRLESTTASQVALFELMIGNLDWSPLKGPDNTCCHNVKLIGTGPVIDPVFPIPYDFDSSGFVDAHYALPPEGLGVRSITTRLYRGYCVNNDTLPAVRRQIQELEPQVMALIRNETRLNDRSRRGAIDYLAEYFEMLRDDEEFAKDVTSACRG
jgi:hypothetical protein